MKSHSLLLVAAAAFCASSVAVAQSIAAPAGSDDSGARAKVAITPVETSTLVTEGDVTIIINEAVAALRKEVARDFQDQGKRTDDLYADAIRRTGSWTSYSGNCINGQQVTVTIASSGKATLKHTGTMGLTIILGDTGTGFSPYPFNGFDSPASGGRIDWWVGPSHATTSGVPNAWAITCRYSA